MIRACQTSGVTDLAQRALPDPANSTVVVPAPAPGAGNWSGAPSAILVEDTFWLTYRVRRPISEGRGVQVVVARSSDGVNFETVTTIGRDQVDCESFERPVLVALPEGGWRLYLSCATWNSKHWWVESLTARTVEALPEGTRLRVLPGDRSTGVKDPVIALDDSGWHLWLCCHPLTEAEQEDRMTSRYLTSQDGLEWQDHGVVLAGRPGSWDARGARITTVLSLEPLTVLYDGRPDAAANWYENTGTATGTLGGQLTALDAAPLRSPESDGACRYASAVPLPDGTIRFYFEAARSDGAHDLVTSLWQPGQ